MTSGKSLGSGVEAPDDEATADQTLPGDSGNPVVRVESDPVKVEVKLRACRPRALVAKVGSIRTEWTGPAQV